MELAEAPAVLQEPLDRSDRRGSEQAGGLGIVALPDADHISAPPPREARRRAVDLAGDPGVMQEQPGPLGLGNGPAKDQVMVQETLPPSQVIL